MTLPRAAALTIVAYAAAAACSPALDAPLTVEEEHEALCGNCHLTPDPRDLPREIWRASVLPNMAARAGYRYGGDPLAGLDLEEHAYTRAAGVYPEDLREDTAAWWRVHDYILSLAPDSLVVDRAALAARHAPLTQFIAEAVALDRASATMVTALASGGESGGLIASDVSGSAYGLPSGERLGTLTGGPIVGISIDGADTLLTDIGSMLPTQVGTGSLVRRSPAGRHTVATDLHRPVYARSVDLDGDGDREVLVCEFGYYTGSLTLLTGEGAAAERRVLLSVPGVIKFEVADLDGDGHLDVAVLASQGDEGVFVLYGDGTLDFSRVERAVRLPPQYGTSWFELLDYDGDGDLDIASANGDNADYSPVLKPYHGVRVFVNDGADAYAQAYFFPLFGATRLVAHDFDDDGDVDLAASAFFPDVVGGGAEAGFVFLERQPVGAAEPFRSYTAPAGADGRWLVSARRDLDGDGDEDLALGSFMLPMCATEDRGAPATSPGAGTDVLLLRNALR